MRSTPSSLSIQASPTLRARSGKPVDVMLPFAPDWRWGPTGSTTPWYSTARLFRQSAIGDWQTVIAEVGDALRHR
jgi:hypothetical protein